MNIDYDNLAQVVDRRHYVTKENDFTGVYNRIPWSETSRQHKQECRDTAKAVVESSGLLERVKELEDQLAVSNLAHELQDPVDNELRRDLALANQTIAELREVIRSLSERLENRTP